MRQNTLHVPDAAVGLGQCRNRAAQDLEVELLQLHLLGQILRHTDTMVVRADEAILRCPVALARIGEDEGMR